MQHSFEGSVLKDAVRESYRLRSDKGNVEAGAAYFDGFCSCFAACQAAVASGFVLEPPSKHAVSMLRETLDGMLSEYIDGEWE